MNNLKLIRTRLGINQTELAKGIGCTQGNVGFIENGQGLSPRLAKRVITFVKLRTGVTITYDDLYDVKPVKPVDVKTLEATQ